MTTRTNDRDSPTLEPLIKELKAADKERSRTLDDLKLRTAEYADDRGFLDWLVRSSTGGLKAQETAVSVASQRLDELNNRVSLLRREAAKAEKGETVDLKTLTELKMSQDKAHRLAESEIHRQISESVTTAENIETALRVTQAVSATLVTTGTVFAVGGAALLGIGSTGFAGSSITTSAVVGEVVTGTALGTAAGTTVRVAHELAPEIVSKSDGGISRLEAKEIIEKASQIAPVAIQHSIVEAASLASGLGATLKIPQATLFTRGAIAGTTGGATSEAGNAAMNAANSAEERTALGIAKDIAISATTGMASGIVGTRVAAVAQSARAATNSAVVASTATIAEGTTYGGIGVSTGYLNRSLKGLDINGEISSQQFATGLSTTLLGRAQVTTQLTIPKSATHHPKTDISARQLRTVENTRPIDQPLPGTEPAMNIPVQANKGQNLRFIGQPANDPIFDAFPLLAAKRAVGIEAPTPLPPLSSQTSTQTHSFPTPLPKESMPPVIKAQTHGNTDTDSASKGQAPEAAIVTSSQSMATNLSHKTPTGRPTKSPEPIAANASPKDVVVKFVDPYEVNDGMNIPTHAKWFADFLRKAPEMANSDNPKAAYENWLNAGKGIRRSSSADEGFGAVMITGLHQNISRSTSADGQAHLLLETARQINQILVEKQNPASVAPDTLSVVVRQAKPDIQTNALSAQPPTSSSPGTPVPTKLNEAETRGSPVVSVLPNRPLQPHELDAALESIILFSPKIGEGRDGMVFHFDANFTNSSVARALKEAGVPVEQALAGKVLKLASPGAIHAEFELQQMARNILSKPAAQSTGETRMAKVPTPYLSHDFHLRTPAARQKASEFGLANPDGAVGMMLMEYINGKSLAQALYRRVLEAHNEKLENNPIADQRWELLMRQGKVTKAKDYEPAPLPQSDNILDLQASVAHLLNFETTVGIVNPTKVAAIYGRNAQKLHNKMRQLELQIHPDFIRQLRQGINELHRNGISHNDLHEGNVMITENISALFRPSDPNPPQTWIIDYGLSIRHSPGQGESGDFLIPNVYGRNLIERK